MTGNHLAIVSTTIHASPQSVWAALVDAESVRDYRDCSEVTIDGKPGSHLLLRGVRNGEPYEEIGTIIEARPGEMLRSTQFDALSGLQDIPENYHTLTFTLEAKKDATSLTLVQDNNDTEDAAQRAEQNWKPVLKRLKKLVESRE